VKKFIKFLYTNHITNVEDHEDELFKLGERLGCQSIFKELDKVEVKLPINRSNSLKAILLPNVSKEIKAKAVEFFKIHANEIMMKGNLHTNKKRIKKYLSKFEEILSLDDFNMDENSILQLILDLPSYMGYKSKQAKELVDRLVNCVRWDRVGYRGFVKALESDYIPQETVFKNWGECVKRGTIGGEWYGINGLPRATFRSVNDKIERVSHNLADEEFDFNKLNSGNQDALKFRRKTRDNQMIRFEFEKSLKVWKVKLTSKGLANILFYIEGSVDKRQWVRCSLIRHMKATWEVEWPPKKSFKWWKLTVVQHSGSQWWFSGVEWFVRNDDEEAFQSNSNKSDNLSELEEGSESDEKSVKKSQNSDILDNDVNSTNKNTDKSKASNGNEEESKSEKSKVMENESKSEKPKKRKDEDTIELISKNKKSNKLSTKISKNSQRKSQRNSQKQSQRETRSDSKFKIKKYKSD
jgi:hypothetical protein